MNAMHERNVTGNSDEKYTKIHFMVGDRRETAVFRPNRISNKELKELFQTAAEAGPGDIVKLRKEDKLLNISSHLSANTSEEPYILQVVGAHLESVPVININLVRELESRLSALECELQLHQSPGLSEPSLSILRELTLQMDIFRTKLETSEHLSWLGFHKKLPRPASSEACKRLKYRRESDTIKRHVREQFRMICDVSLSETVSQWLRSPSFDARQWKDEELLLMLQTMFIELDLLDTFAISLSTLRNFLYEVYNNYNAVPFHNFRHCFCVAQMMYTIIWAVDLLSKIGHLEVLVLIVSCICHDLDHPGYNNIYQINARTELALRYNDISPLENHHCSVAFRVLEYPECNILASLDTAAFRTVREGIIRCILATDMARHNEILGQFTETVPEFDYSDKSQVNLLSMVLIKVADISNEARPIDVAEPWLDQLLQEFFKQSDAEKLEGLPVTPFMDRDKITKPSSQCSFIGLVLLPLFEVLGQLLHELEDLIVQPVRVALEYYRDLNEAAKDERHRKSVIDFGVSTVASGPSSGTSSVIKSISSHSMWSKRSRSNSIEDEPADTSLDYNSENAESSDSETATEVEVSEKTLKFKISTETSLPAESSRRSYPGSRKGSREKASIDYCHYDLTKAVCDEKREWNNHRGQTLNSAIRSVVNAKPSENARILAKFEQNESLYANARITKHRTESNDVIRQDSKNRPSRNKTRDSTFEGSMKEYSLQCNCDIKTVSNNHKSILSRLRNLTDRIGMSFEGKDQLYKSKLTTKSLTNTQSVFLGSISRQSEFLCKHCNLIKTERNVSIKDHSQTARKLFEQHPSTLPTFEKHGGKSKSWRMVFTKEKLSSASLEVLIAHDVETSAAKHKRNLSNPERKLSMVKTMDITEDREIQGQKPLSVEAIGARNKPKLEFVVQPGCSQVVDEDMKKMGIRRSSASMEDISNIMKQTEGILLGTLDDKMSDEIHTGSLDSILYRKSGKDVKKTFVFTSPVSTRKTSLGLFSRFRSGMSIDGNRMSSNNGSSLHYQPTHSGWISSLTASFRPKRQVMEEVPASPGHA